MPAAKKKRRPSGPSGKHQAPRISLSAPPDVQERWRAAAARAGLTLAEWLRRVADIAAIRPHEYDVRQINPSPVDYD